MITRNEKHKTVYYTYNDDPKLPTIIMIHGFRGTHHGLDLIASQLNGKRVIIPDLPGFGETSPLDDGHSLENYANWLNNFIKSLDLTEKPALLGHSFGSIIVSKYMSLFPESISRLILVNPIGAPALKGPKAIMTRLALAYYWLGRHLPEKSATYILSSKPVVMIMSNTMAKTSDKKLRQFIHNQHLMHFSSFANRKVVAEAFDASIKHTVRDFAKQIPTPTLLIVGSDDDITPLNKQHELHKLFPNAAIHIIPNVGHLTHYETPEIVADAIKIFVR